MAGNLTYPSNWFPFQCINEISKELNLENAMYFSNKPKEILVDYNLSGVNFARKCVVKVKKSYRREK